MTSWFKANNVWAKPNDSWPKANVSWFKANHSRFKANRSWFKAESIGPLGTQLGRYLNGSDEDNIEETAKKPVRSLKCKHPKGFCARIVCI